MLCDVSCSVLTLLNFSLHIATHLFSIVAVLVKIIDDFFDLQIECSGIVEYSEKIVKANKLDHSQ